MKVSEMNTKGLMRYAALMLHLAETFEDSELENMFLEAFGAFTGELIDREDTLTKPRFKTAGGGMKIIVGGRR